MSHAKAKKRYKTTNWTQYNASLKARGSLMIGLNKRMTWFVAASGKRQTWAQSEILWRSDSVLFDAQELVWLGPASGNRFDGICARAVRAQWANAGLQYILYASPDAECSDALHTKPSKVAPAGGFSRNPIFG